jgi:hypothetical protein
MAEDRLARIEAEQAQLTPSLRARLEKLEKTAEEKPGSGYMRFVKWMGQALPSLIGSLVLLGVGYMLKDSLDLAIKQQTLQLSYVKEMKEQLLAMAKEGAKPEDIERAAVLVAGFGQPAVLPLMNELRYGGNRALGAESGLRSLAFMQPESVCAVVLRVLESPAQLLGWEGHAAAARTLAGANCSAALPVLQKHAAMLGPAANGRVVDVTALVSDKPNLLQQKEWLRELERSVARLSAAAKRGA